ncbi:ATP-dependent DNA helicase RecG [Arthrobacter sp. AOP36-C1-22]|uniref:ATP-dependent DNA helicase RecG n=1 Tax=Arthrobacter sp. AOP36-C1-22 TaxID=3457683 RepID=UPI0040337EBC
MADSTSFGPETPLRSAIGSRAADAVAKAFQLETCGELLHHFPRRYLDVGELTRIDQLPFGETVTVVARVVSSEQRRMQRRKGMLLQVAVEDELGETHGRLNMTFFNGYKAARELTTGTVAMFSGKVGAYRQTLQLAQPEYALLETADDAEPRPIPIYPATAAVSSQALRGMMELVLAGVSPETYPDPLLASLREKHRLPELARALYAVHAPDTVAHGEAAKKRFRYDEALVLQLALAERRAHRFRQPATARVGGVDGMLNKFEASLPFTLTEGQVRAGLEISADLARQHPMNRLLQGEVGSGKTVVALRAMLQVIDAGAQTALMVPTEVLAQQHYASISRMLGPLGRAGQLDGDPKGTRVDLLTGSMPVAQRREVLLRVASGETGILIGTHALLSENVIFAELGFVVVDEQHRFGVEQRDTLRAKGSVQPHMLVMTATPIPRTVAITVFGDLEISTLSELPAGRAPTSTYLVDLHDERYRDRMFALMREEVDRGHQVYLVCPRISEQTAEEGMGPESSTSEGTGPEAGSGGADRLGPPAPPKATVEEMYQRLGGMPLFEGIGIDMLHGRMTTEEKTGAMSGFESGETGILVSTTVIEVGVDVPNATAMIILDADSFGVSQLHQLRGRVGRGGLPGTCLLASWLPSGHPSLQRLAAVANTTDGFELAEVDLAERREGDVLGARQSGTQNTLKILRVVRERKIITAARTDAEQIVESLGGLAGHPGLRQLVHSWVDDDMQAFLERG